MSTGTKTRTAPVDSVNITNQPDVIAAAKRAAYLKTVEKAGEDAKEERKALEEGILRPALAGASKAILRGVVAYNLQRSSNSHIDKDKLLAGWPEAYAATFVKTPYTFVKYGVTPEVQA